MGHGASASQSSCDFFTAVKKSNNIGTNNFSPRKIGMTV